MKDHGRRTTIFGRAYVWRRKGDRLELHPDTEAYTLFPYETRRATMRARWL